MASPFLRNLRLRHMYHSLNSRLHASGFHSLSDKSLQNSPLNLFSLDGFSENQYKFRAFWMNHRFLCTGSTNPSVNKASSSNVGATPSGGLAEGNHGNKNNGEQDAGGSQSTSQQGKPVRRGPVSWMSFFLLLCTGAGLVYYYDKEKRRHIEGITNASNAVRQGPSVGKAAIGGPFNLIDHNAKSVSDKDFLGKWNLIYFGFTHCPDICPDELQKMASAIDKIKEKSGIEVVPVFISVDPERDTVEQVREYVKEFHPKLIGLTGTPDEIKNAARAYRVYYMKTEEEGSDYLVDHSIVMYLMDPDMQFVKFFGKNLDDTSLAEGVIQEIKQHKKVKA
ncbi:putative cytochrome C oxidase assembly protein [Handroanthus impetiginosus]|uniref:Putative cytochrome C oxidase assembly protein n=1 Tax=Handroanthus impetiginosus TaxID=429701 RepID=A0A2G9HJH3_9LAMI|nr:putative cytochrome C oxidase assembly protein [Handroanthus impetiginosus]